MNDNSGARDFDFLVGSWEIAHRRLRSRLAGSDQWDEFAGTSECRPILAGNGNIDEYAAPSVGMNGIALRLFDPQARQWSIYWVNAATGMLEPPVLGRFRDGRGDFYGDDTHDGRPIKVHFIWSHITPQSARWEQRFSGDGGTWELNWIMEFRRVPGGAAASG